MNMTEKNGQPSMEEILASIRRIIAEEPSGHPSHGELRGTPIMLKGDVALDDAGDFDLPAIFRSSPPAAAERQAPLLGRLTDAIRGATAAQPEGRGLFNGDDEFSRTAPVEGGSLSAEPSANPNAGLSSLKSVRSSEPAASSAPGVAGPAAGAPVAPAPSDPQSSAFPVAASSGSSGPEAPRRVMAPFKDTHFLRMSAPTGAAPAPEAAQPEPAPVVAQPAPAPAPIPAPLPATGPSVDFAAIIPGQIERPALIPQAPAAAPQSMDGGEEQPVTVAVPAAPFTAAAAPPPPLPSVIASPPAVVAAPAPQAEATGSIEDATADLLRPMLRQWLADNMPRMVEKALHIEIAESVKAPKKP